MHNTVFMRFPGGLAKALTLSYDDGVTEDIRLIEIMKRHGLKGTFNLNSLPMIQAEETRKNPKPWANRLTVAEAKALYSQEGIEPAVHAYTHPFLQNLPPHTVAQEIIDDRKFLEELFGRPIRGMAYPFGTYSDNVVEVLENCGIAYSRTVTSTERFDLPTDWLRMPATCHHKNPRLMELADQFLEKKYGAEGQPSLFYLWGHSYEFAQHDNWRVIEDFAAKMGGKEDIWYATNIEIYDYVRAFQSLSFTVGMTRVENPTAKTVWFNLQGKCYSVAPGELIVLGDNT